MTDAPKPEAGQPQSAPTDEQQTATPVQEISAADLDQVVGGATSALRISGIDVKKAR